jgi:TRAP-type mannitol/chloroaromatic compound transport system permease small subunit
VFERICTYAARFAAVLLLVLMCVIIYDVVGRRFYNTGSVALQELEWHLHGAIALLGLGYTYTRNGHVRIDLVQQHFSDRARLWLEIMGIMVFLTPFLIAVVYFGYEFTSRSFVRNEGSTGGLGLSNRWIIKSTVPISAMVALFGAWSVAINAFAVLRGTSTVTSPFKEGSLWKS